MSRAKYEYSRLAPPELVKLHKAMAGKVAGDAPDHLYALVSKSSEPVMRQVWESLKQHCRPMRLLQEHIAELKKRDEFKTQRGKKDIQKLIAELRKHVEPQLSAQEAYEFWFAVHKALTPPPEHKRRTPVEHEKQLLSIASKIEDLRKKWSRQYSLQHVYLAHLIPDETISAIACGLGESISFEQDVTVEVRPEKLKDAFLLRPSVPELLDALKDLVKQKAGEPPLLTHVKSESYDARYFAVVMTSHMVEHYSQPLRKVVASVGSLFFGEMTEEFVRKNAPMVVSSDEDS